ncbi:MAG TPA: TlpA disulfide reductase family protein [Azospirillaceae bacterium]|nr:TlpA disulfide reductase family protein [Azospirillaceae bacterium]
MNTRGAAVAAILFAVGLLVLGGVGAVAWLAGPEQRDAPPASATAQASLGQLGRPVPTDPPRPVPELSFKDGEGRTVGLADFRGQAVLLNLWATWCVPCVREMPALDRLQALAGGQGVHVVALSLDRGGLDQVRPFYARHGLVNLGIYLDPGGDAMRAFQPRGLPTSILIDPDGREVGRVEGEFAWDGPEALDLVRRAAGRTGG